MAAPPTEPVASPCIQLCRLNERQVCVGCGRTIDEIVEWSQAPAARKRRICESARRRLIEAGGKSSAR